MENSKYEGISGERINSFLHPDNWNTEKIRDIISQVDDAGGKKMLKQQLSSTSNRKDLTTELSLADYPIHFIYGEQHKLVKPSTTAAIASNRDNISRTIITGAGHMLPLERAQALSKILKKIF